MPKGGKVTFLLMEENKTEYIGGETVPVADRDFADIGQEDISEKSIKGSGEDDSKEASESERDEYDRLIKTRFKDLYAEDVQKMINRRFRKYKVLEEKCKALEEVLAQRETDLDENKQKLADLDAVLHSEIEKAVKETEERVIREIRTRKMRPSENGVFARGGRPSFDVSGLTKSERADLAKRAAEGEKIRF